MSVTIRRGLVCVLCGSQHTDVFCVGVEFVLFISFRCLIQGGRVGLWRKKKICDNARCFIGGGGNGIVGLCVGGVGVGGWRYVGSGGGGDYGCMCGVDVCF